jgi:surfactin synthase thioesterase subunit
LTLEGLQALPMAARVQALHAKMVANEVLSPRAPPAAIEAMARVFKSQVSSRYTPHRTYAGPVLGIYAREDGRESNSEAAQWARLAPKFNMACSAGNHMTMLKEKHAPELARIVNGAWGAPPTR